MTMDGENTAMGKKAKKSENIRSPINASGNFSPQAKIGQISEHLRKVCVFGIARTLDCFLVKCAAV